MSNTDLHFYWRLLLRRLPAMMALFLFAAAIGVALAIKLPTTYASSARLLVESPQIPGELASSTVSTNPGEQIEIIRQRLLTRANLIDIAREFDVFENINTMSPDEIVSSMRANTRIDSSGRPLLVTISFSAGNPRTAADVVNKYVTLILEANTELRTDQAGGTLDFFEQEVLRLGQNLDAQSARILDFKNEFADALPEKLNYRLQRQTNLEERVARIERDRSLLLDQRNRIITLYETTGRLQPASERQLSPEERQLASLREELEAGLLIYSEDNPRIQVIKSRLAQLEGIVATQTNSATPVNDQDEQAALFDLALAEIDSQILALDTELAEAEIEQQDLTESIARTPMVRIELDALERDYGNIQGQYNSAVARLSQASVGERIELSARGQRIAIIEPPNVPNGPTSPNRPLVAGMGIFGGMALAGGLFLLLELLNRSIRRPTELVSSLGITPLGTIPMLETRLQRGLRRGRLILMAIIVIVGVPGLLWTLDTYYQPLDLIFDRIVAQVGL